MQTRVSGLISLAFELAVVACRFDGALKQETRRLSGGGEAARLWPR